jgi:hypothetical protein
MAGEGYSIIPISAEHQLQYACNVLNLGGGRIIRCGPPWRIVEGCSDGGCATRRQAAGLSLFATLAWSATPCPSRPPARHPTNPRSVHGPSARQIVRHPAFAGDVRVIDFSSITSMYGSVHCASQVVMRRPRRSTC